MTLSLISGNHILTTEFLVANINHLVMSPSNGAVTITCQQSESFIVNSVIVSGSNFKKCSVSRFVMVTNLVLSNLTFYSQDWHGLNDKIN